jgi:hypothetical protein
MRFPKMTEKDQQLGEPSARPSSRSDGSCHLRQAEQKKQNGRRKLAALYCLSESDIIAPNTELNHFPYARNEG